MKQFATTGGYVTDWSLEELAQPGIEAQEIVPSFPGHEAHGHTVVGMGLLPGLAVVRAVVRCRVSGDDGPTGDSK